MKCVICGKKGSKEHVKEWLKWIRENYSYDVLDTYHCSKECLDIDYKKNRNHTFYVKKDEVL